MVANTDALTTALDYIGRGWAPIPIKYQQKAPTVDAWQSLKLTEDTAPDYFNGKPSNVGVVLGSLSRGLTDIDLDCPEALELAPCFLPATEAIFGRKSTPASHWLYQQTALEMVKRLQDPAAKQTGHKGTLVEFRAGGDKGAQTVFPGSTHKETGQLIEWYSEGDAASVNGEHLYMLVRTLAAACLLVRYWPEGSRHDAAMAFAGGMARGGQSLEKTQYILKAVCDAAGDSEVGDRLRAAEDSYQKVEAGEQVTGWPSLKDYMPSEKVVDKLIEWLDAKARKGTRTDESFDDSGAPGAAGGSFDVTALDRLPQYVDRIDAYYGSQSEPALFVRGGSLTQIVEVAPGTVRGVTHKESHYESFRLHTPIQLQTQLTRDFNFYKPGDEGDYAVVCPAVIAQAVLHRGFWSIPPLSAITQAPTIRPDGTLLQTPGYDRETGIYLKLPKDFPTLAGTPTKDEAISALEFLNKPFKEFPYTTEACRSVALGALITALVRPSLRSAPAFAFSGAKMGEGKSLQAEIASKTATGTLPAMMTRTEDREEMRKRIVSLLISGAPVANLDNVNGTLESEILCTVLTEPTFQDRILGASRMVSLPTTCTWMITGNHIRVAGDLTTRVLLAELDSGEEHPEMRTGFELNLHEWMPANRYKLISAALTIVRAYWAAGCPDTGLTPWGRFEEWSRLVRDPLVWAGAADPVETVSLIQADDPRREELFELLEAWHAVFGSDAMLIKDVVKRVESVFVESVDKDLRELLVERFGDNDKINARRLAGYIRQQQNRVENGYCFKSQTYGARHKRWQVLKRD